ncbi:hypothetical protein Noda2021_08810 [Candidatus Dependentiae bacterium Noda2021]|nr:hypothetical protein Noda2021_08810 [Candidatus Dependentiae bacterium Noda2021]
MKYTTITLLILGTLLINLHGNKELTSCKSYIPSASNCNYLLHPVSVQPCDGSATTHTALLPYCSQLLGQIPFLLTSKDFCAGNIMRGGYQTFLMRYAVDAPIIPPLSQEHYLNTIVDIIWYLYAEALNKNEPFDHGTIVIKDTNFVLHDFLLHYVKLVNPKVRGNLKDTPHWVSFNPFGYSRASTHFSKAQNESRQYGIDVRYHAAESLRNSLPSGKSHILFGKVEPDLQLMFIKLEHHGIYAYDGLLGHISGFFASKTRKSLPTLEKILPRSWYCWLEKKVGHNDDPASRRERVPHAVKQQFKALIRTSAMSPVRKKQCIQAVEHHGIKAVYSFVVQEWRYLKDILKHKASKKQLHKTWLPQPFLEKLDCMINELGAYYDYLSLRTGREVILTDSELSSSLYYYLLITDPTKAAILKPFFDHLTQARICAKTIHINTIIEGYCDSTKPPLSCGIQSLLRNITYFNEQAFELIAHYSPILDRVLQEEIFSLKKMAN